MAERHCLDRLDAYLEGAQSPSAARRVERHLAACPSCAAVARDRARVLVAARSVAAPPAAPAVSAPVLRPSGVSGRLVAGALTLLVLVSGLLAAVWLAGAPRADDAAAPPGGQALAEPTSAPEALEALRSDGWTVARLTAAGLVPQDVRTERDGDAEAVAVTWTSAAGTAAVRECRGASTSVPQDCPADGADAATTEALDAADAVRVAGATDARIVADPAGEGWVARLRTGREAYRVASTLPRARAEGLLAQLVAAERSGLTAIRHDDAVRDRLERGLSRLTDTVPNGARPSGPRPPERPHDADPHG